MIFALEETQTELSKPIKHKPKIIRPNEAFERYKKIYKIRANNFINYRNTSKTLASTTKTAGRKKICTVVTKPTKHTQAL